jgi:hypothetical protein
MRRSRWVRIELVLAAMVLLVASFGSPSQAAEAPPVAGVHVGPLRDVVAIGPADVWAVGVRGVVTHWDGARWQTQQLGGMLVPDLTAVDAVSSSDVWAVGGVVAYEQRRPFLSHWNGSSWIRAKGPSFPGEVILRDVAVVSATDAWAVGSTLKQTATGVSIGGIVLRWNGSSWRRMSSPAGVSFSGVALVRGAPIASGARTATSTPVIARRVGGQWRVLPMPEPPGRTCDLSGITGAPPAAAGTCTSGGTPTPYLVARDGGAWDLARARGTGALFDVGGGPVAWAVGRARPSEQPMALRRHASDAWVRVATPRLKGGGVLEAVDVRAFADAWAVGWRGGASRSALVLHWDGSTWKVARAP